jgi:hypothetical protein
MRFSTESSVLVIVVGIVAIVIIRRTACAADTPTEIAILERASPANPLEAAALVEREPSKPVLK